MSLVKEQTAKKLTKFTVFRGKTSQLIRESWPLGSTSVTVPLRGIMTV